MGYFIGRLNRARVRVLCKEGVEILSDFHGILYIRMDTGGGWKLRLARELKESGFDINVNNAL
jgi:predicted nucleotide-binding protein